MVKFYQCFKSVFALTIALVFSTFMNAQQGRLPNQQELDLKDNLLKLYKGNTTARLAPNHLAVTGPEQDCDNAIPVCQQSYNQSTSYTGSGTIQEVNGTCLSTQETNSVWYVFTVQNSGTFTFMLNTANDYDFALYDITSIGCSGVPSATPIRCNFSATYGNTGLTLPTAGGNLSYNASQSPLMAGINVTAGQTFVLIVDNFSANTNGYTLTFGGTAQIFDNTAPTISSSSFPCNGSSIRINFSEPVSCSSIATNGSDFTITGPSGPVPVTSAVGNLCSTGASNTNYATVNFNNTGLPSGTYTVAVTTGTDGNTLIDKCGNNMAVQTVTFQFLAPITVSATATSICAGSPTTLSVTVPGNPAGVTYAWSPTGATTNTITVSPSANITYVVNVTLGGCSRSVSQAITITQPPVVSVNPSNISLCSGTTNIIASAMMNGVPCASCNYTWTGSSTQVDNAVPSSTVAGAGAGSYSVTVSTSNGCLGNTAVSNVSILSPASTPACNIIYASPTGTLDGLTPSTPTSIQNALTMAACNNIVIKMQVGNYAIDNPLNVNSFITMEGGYNVGFTSKTSSKSIAGVFPNQGTTITRSTANVEDPASTKRITAINVVAGSSYFRIQDIRIEMPNNAAGTGISNYGIYLGNGCSNYNITRCYINSGNAGSGGNGTAAVGVNTPGTPGKAGGVGGNGNNTANAGGTFGDGGAEASGAGSTHTSMYWNFLGGASNGTSTLAAEVANGGFRSGGEGGAGGSGGYFDEDGGNGSNGGAGGGGALGGVPPANSGGWWDCGWAAIMDGFNGNPGSPGANGAVGATGPAGADVSGFWIPGGQGGVGGDGAGGGGGSGAGGGAGDGSGFLCFNTSGTGGGGGGGGGGGQGGVGGTGGFGGGSTFGVFIFNNGVSGNIVDCQIVNGTAGAGGTGGAGTTGANGGVGGTRGCADACNGQGEGNGGTGGAGGKGGNGGTGGSGAAGIASTVRLVGGSALVTNVSTFTLATQPVLTADNKACTNVSIAHTSTVVTPTWSSFGTSASPASAAGSPASTTYTTTGRKTLVLNTSSYTDFNNIIVNPPSTGNVIASAVSICPGAANFISSVAGTAGLTYSWSALPAGGTISSATTSSTSITFANAGASPITYTVTLNINSQCCGTLTPVTQTIIVYPNPANPTALVNATCVGGTATFTASTPAGSSFNWYNAASSGTLLATGNTYSITGVSTPTTVYLQAINAGGCTSTLTAVPVTPTTIPTPTALSATSCDPGMVQVGITPAAGVSDYNWYSDAGGTTLVQTGTTLNYSQNIPASGGSYTVYVQSNMAGCTPSALIPVTGSVTGTPIVANGLVTANDTVCANTPITISLNPTGGNGSFSYAWSPVTSTLSSITQTATTSIGYNVTITSGSCSKQFNFPIIVNPYPKDTIGTPMVISCTNPTIALDGSFSASGPSISYSWTTSGGNITSVANTNTVNIDAPGTYNLMVTDNATGCSSNQTVTVNGNSTIPTLTLSPTVYTLTCASPTVTLNASTSTGSVSYAWSTTGGILTATNVSNPVASAAGTYSVVLTNTVNGCQATATATLVPDATIPTVTITSTSLTLTCISASETVTVNVSPASDITYAWNPVPAGGTATAPSFNSSGTYTCVITNTVNSCATSVQVTVSTNTTVPTITITPTQTLTCATTTAAISTTVNPSSGVSYTWTGTGVTGLTTSSVSVNQAGAYDVMVLDAANGCTNTASSSIVNGVVTPTITVAPITTTLTCLTTTINLNATASTTNAPVWATPSGTASNPVVANTAGNYIVSVTDAATGCTETQTIVINSDTNPPTVSAGALTPIACGSVTAVLNGSSTPSTGVTYSWNGPSATSIVSGSTTINPTVGEVGDYTLTATGSNGCSASSTVAVIQGSVNAQFTANPTTGTVPLLVDFMDQSFGAINYSWNFGDGNSATVANPSNTFSVNGVYTVTLVVSSGLCTDTAYATIIVEQGLTLEIPNVFTPNNDGSNDVFIIKSAGVKSIALQIFNRWGEKLYEFSGDKAAWDGSTPNGAKVPAGTYFYFVKATGFDDKEVEQHGTVNLFR